MEAENEDRYTDEPKSAGLPVIPVALAALVLVAAAYWYFSGTEPDQTPAPAASAPVVPAEPIVPIEPEPAPDIPEPAPVVPEPSPEPNEPPAPVEPPLLLEASDPVVREELQPTLQDNALAVALDSDNLIERSAALIDLTRQGRVEPKLFPLPRPQGNFAVVTKGDNTYMDPEGFARYDGHAQAISTLDPQRLASAFHQFRPLLEQAYAALGYEADTMDNGLIKALDQVIAAPVLEHPPAVVKDITTYNFADEHLEELSPLAKQLIRMGPDNQAMIQAQAKAIRAALLKPAD